MTPFPHFFQFLFKYLLPGEAFPNRLVINSVPTSPSLLSLLNFASTFLLPSDIVYLFF